MIREVDNLKRLSCRGLKTIFGGAASAEPTGLSLHAAAAQHERGDLRGPRSLRSWFGHFCERRL